MIIGFDFSMEAGTGIVSVEDAIECIKPLLADDANVTITDLSYDFVGSYGQSQKYAVSCRIEGKVWREG